MATEYEAKFLDIDLAIIRWRLKKLNATLIEKDRLMRRQTFFPPDGNPQKWGRVRDEGNIVTMTIKERLSDTLAGTQEYEVGITNDFDTGCAFLRAAGFTPNAYQENRRETWTLDGTEITIDTWPGLKPLSEIEGASEAAVADIASRLGLNMAEARFGGIMPVYKTELGISEADFMALKSVTFASPPRSVA